MNATAKMDSGTTNLALRQPWKERRWIESFLYFGYVPDAIVDVHAQPWARDRSAQRRALKALTSRQLVVEGVRVLKQVFREEVPKRNPVVSLSGGSDSRAILGGLLEHYEASKIMTATYGTAGTFDYEIGWRVALEAGVRHESIDLTSIPWQMSDLLGFAMQHERPLPFFQRYLGDSVHRRFGAAYEYWNGFFGDPLAGGHLAPTEASSWGEAVTAFTRWNRAVTSVDLAPRGFDPAAVLPKAPWCDHTDLGYDDQLDFSIRQMYRIMPKALKSRYTYRTPFLAQVWVDFILSVPRRYRVHAWLYHEILKSAYPSLFSLPTTTKWGMSLRTPPWRVWLRRRWIKACRKMERARWGRQRTIHPRTNFLDFNQELRGREDLKTVVWNNLHDLKHRGIVDWIDIDRIWTRHQQGRNHADALLMLAALELWLKSDASRDRVTLPAAGAVRVQ